MRRFVLFFTAAVMCAQFAGAQSVNGLFNRFKNADGAISASMGKVMLKIPAEKAPALSDKLTTVIRSVKVVILDKSAEGAKERFAEAVSKMSFRGYGLLADLSSAANGGGAVYTKSARGNIRELLVVATGEKTCGLVWVRCDIDKKDLKKMLGNSNVSVGGFDLNSLLDE